MSSVMLPPPRHLPVAWKALGAPPRRVQAFDWRWLDRESIRLLVIHTTECGEVHGAASGVAAYFHTAAKDAAGNRLWRSSHLVVDAAEVIECVSPQHEAYAARGGNANATGYHIELCGHAAQTPLEWEDAYSRGELELAARAAADVAARYGIPPVKLTPVQIANGASGFCGHRDITAAWHVPGGHSDPGVGFPWGSFLARVQSVGAPP